ncbi:MAG: preprotein translocase subunit SecY [Bacteroidota bacterium]|jgi:preprotein translocase subunit SecY
MKGLFQKLRDIYHHEELRKKILFTLALLLVYRIGSYIVLPGVDSSKLDQGDQSGLMGLLGLFTGGAFSRASIFALGIMPYISASIIIQLLGLAVPTIQKLQKEGESGRKKINQWTRMLTIAIGVVQAPGYILSTIDPGARPDSALWVPAAVIILTCSTLFILWMGEKITDKGIGNGISLIIMVGILADLPGAFYQEASTQSLYFFIVELAVLFAVVGFCVAIVQAVRRVPVQMARMNAGTPSHLPQGEGARSFIPLRVNSAGVMPIIFAQAIMFLPLYLQQMETFRDNAVLTSLGNVYGFWYNMLFFVMIVLFTYFYTAITTNPANIAEDLKRNGNFIPGVKPGKPTSDFIDNVLSKITLPGGVFVGIVAILPALVFVSTLTKTQGFALFYGGTSLLITVGVLLDTLQQIESHLLSRHYDGLMKSGRIRGRSTSATTMGTGSPY